MYKFKRVHTLGQYISFTKSLVTKTSWQNHVSLNEYTVIFLRSLNELEVQYFKVENKTGAAIIILEVLIKTISSQTWSSYIEDIVLIIQSWLRAIKEDLIIQHYTKNWWSFLMRIILFIQKLCDIEKFAEKFLDQTSEILLELATSELLDLKQINIVLKCINKFAKCNKEMRLLLMDRYEQYFIKLTKYMATCGHLDMQLTIMECLLRFFVQRQVPTKRAEVIDKWFPAPLYSSSARNMFINRPFISVLQDMRDFIMVVNASNGHIFSFECSYLTIGNLCSEMYYFLDINTYLGSISVRLEKEVLTHFINGGEETHTDVVTDQDVITISKSTTKNVTFILEESPIIKINLSETPEMLYEIHSVIFKDDLKSIKMQLADKNDINQVDKALRHIFQEKYQRSNVMPVDESTRNTIYESQDALGPPIERSFLRRSGFASFSKRCERGRDVTFSSAASCKINEASKIKDPEDIFNIFHDQEEINNIEIYEERAKSTSIRIDNTVDSSEDVEFVESTPFVYVSASRKPVRKYSHDSAFEVILRDMENDMQVSAIVHAQFEEHSEAKAKNDAANPQTITDAQTSPKKTLVNNENVNIDTDVSARSCSKANKNESTINLDEIIGFVAYEQGQHLEENGERSRLNESARVTPKSNAKNKIKKANVKKNNTKTTKRKAPQRIRKTKASKQTVKDNNDLLNNIEEVTSIDKDNENTPNKAPENKKGASNEKSTLTNNGDSKAVTTRKRKLYSNSSNKEDQVRTFKKNKISKKKVAEVRKEVSPVKERCDRRDVNKTELQRRSKDDDIFDKLFVDLNLDITDKLVKVTPSDSNVYNFSSDEEDCRLKKIRQKAGKRKPRNKKRGKISLVDEAMRKAPEKELDLSKELILNDKEILDEPPALHAKPKMSEHLGESGSPLPELIIEQDVKEKRNTSCHFDLTNRDSVRSDTIVLSDEPEFLDAERTEGPVLRNQSSKSCNSSAISAKRRKLRLSDFVHEMAKSDNNTIKEVLNSYASAEVAPVMLEPVQAAPIGTNVEDKFERAFVEKIEDICNGLQEVLNKHKDLMRQSICEDIDKRFQMLNNELILAVKREGDNIYYRLHEIYDARFNSTE